jgi:hypothetical protein
MAAHCGHSAKRVLTKQCAMQGTEKMKYKTSDQEKFDENVAVLP